MISFQSLGRRYQFHKTTDTLRINCHSCCQSPQGVHGLCDASVYSKTLSRLFKKVHFSTLKQLLHINRPQIQRQQGQILQYFC